MQAITLKAHFDGRQIVLDEPYELPRDARLVVTVLPETDKAERGEWAQVAATGLAAAYSDNEPEYSPSDVKT